MKMVSETTSDFDPLKKPAFNKYAFGCAMLASTTCLILGYDIGVSTGAHDMIKKDLKLTHKEIENLETTRTLFSILGSAVAGRTCDWIGRRYTLVVTYVFFFVGAVVTGCFGLNYWLLMTGRSFTCIGTGYALVIAPIYTVEISPPSYRGFLTSFPQIFTGLAMVPGYITKFKSLPIHLCWNIMFGLNAIPSLVLAGSILIMPESPRWLVMQDHIDDAMRVLDKISGSRDEAVVRLAAIKAEAGDSNEQASTDSYSMAVKISGSCKNGNGNGVWRELLFCPSPAIRHIVIACIGFHFCFNMTGINTVLMNIHMIFEIVGIETPSYKQNAYVILLLIKAGFILVSAFLLDKIGRRPLILVSYAGIIVCLLALGTVEMRIINGKMEKLQWTVILCAVAILLYILLFSVGPGTITWVYCAEIFPLKLRAQGVSMGVATNFILSAAIRKTIAALRGWIPMVIVWAYFFYAGVSVVVWIFFYTSLPETKGVALEEMEGLFGNFNWKCSGCDMKNRNSDVGKSCENEEEK